MSNQGSGTGETREPAFDNGCECDSCCRLEELRVQCGIAEGTADEIAGTVSTIVDVQRDECFAVNAALSAALGRAQRAELALREIAYRLHEPDVADDANGSRGLAKSALAGLGEPGTK